MTIIFSNRSIEQSLKQVVEELKKVNKTLDKIVVEDVVPPSFQYSVGLVVNKKQEGKKCMLEVSITNEQKINVTLHPVTGGVPPKPAQVDGAPTWEVVTGSSTVVPAEDGLSADLISSDDPGDTDFLVKADADLGEGVQEISDIVRLSVKGAQAANLGLVAGDPTPKG